MSAVVFGLSVHVLRTGKVCLSFPRKILRQRPEDPGEASLQKRLVKETAQQLAQGEMVVERLEQHNDVGHNSVPALSRAFADGSIVFSGEADARAGRAFMRGKESRHRLLELARSAGIILSYMASISLPSAMARCASSARSMCWHIHRALRRVSFADFCLRNGELHKRLLQRIFLKASGLTRGEKQRRC